LQNERVKLEAQRQKATKTKDIQEWVGFNFESSTGLTPQFAQFARDFKKHIKSILPEGIELVNWSRGHFEVYGFIKQGKKHVYFTINDVRFFQDEWNSSIMIRTAENDEDYTGGSNRYTTLEGFTEAVQKLLTKNFNKY